jgi:putative ABC transport system ATP-binding protein
MTRLRFERVTKRRGEGRHAVTALREVSFEILPGELALLEGPSGSGKTTLLAVAAGLLRPDSGSVLFDDLRLDHLSRDESRRFRSKNVGFVFQRSHLLGSLSARENVLLPALLAGFPRVDAEREATEILTTLGMAELGGRFPAELSGGEEQRVAVARALVHRPRLVLADEPTAWLDSASGETVVGQLRALAASRGASVLLATHDERIERFASRRFRLLDGILAPDLDPA